VTKHIGDLPRLYSAQEVADYLGATRFFVETEARAGRLRGMKIHRRWAFTEQAVARFLEEREEVAVARARAADPAWRPRLTEGDKARIRRRRRR
jgi:excisionase family DNA binding protein